jgi:uncharacterized membrane protein YgcG
MHILNRFIDIPGARGFYQQMNLDLITVEKKQRLPWIYLIPYVRSMLPPQPGHNGAVGGGGGDSSGGSDSGVGESVAWPPLQLLA